MALKENRTTNASQVTTETIPPRSKTARLDLVLALLVVSQFVVVLDFSIVQIALPTIREQMGMSLSGLQWIVSAYGLTFAGFLMLSGRASDLYGRRRMFMIGLMVFALSSLAGGLAPSELALIVARGVQGVGAAISSATGLSLLIANFAPVGRLNRSLGIFTAVSSAAFAAGVILGGVLTASLGWRSIFFVNVPIGIVATILAPKLLSESRGALNSRHLDVPGAVTVTAGLILLVYALTNATNASLFSFQTLLPLLLSALTLAAFFGIEHRSRAPIMPLGFLKRGAVFTANAIAVLSYSANSSLVFILTIYLQQLEGYSALSAGLAFIPGALVIFVFAGFVSPRLVGRFGLKSVLVVSLAIMTVGLVMFTPISPSESYFTAILPALLMFALGASIAVPAMFIAASSATRQGEEGLASGLINTSSQIGGPIGLAMVVTVTGFAAQSFRASVSSAALVAGFHYALIGAAILSGIAIVFALAIGRQGRPSQDGRSKA